MGGFLESQYFCNADNDGSQNYNNASNTNGVRDSPHAKTISIGTI